jgi:hypothetical protein
MGGITNKEKAIIIKQNPIFNNLIRLLNEFEENINQLEKEEFDSFEQLNSLDLKNKIEKCENDINDELINLRMKIKKNFNSKDYNKDEKDLNNISNRTQNLYSRKSELIKNKIKPNE